MRRGNLPDEGHNKITWKRIRDLLRRRRDNVTLKRGGDVLQRRYWVFYLGLTGDVVDTSWWSTNETSLGVSFETCLRRCEDVLMRRCRYVLLRSHHDVPIKCCGDISLRRLDDVSSRRRWVFHLRCTCDIAGTYREMSLWRRHDVLLPVGLSDVLSSKFAIFCYSIFIWCQNNLRSSIICCFFLAICRFLVFYLLFLYSLFCLVK